jgi:hypothetical protein
MCFKHTVGANKCTELSLTLSMHARDNSFGINVFCRLNLIARFRVVTVAHMKMIFCGIFHRIVS